MSLNCGCGQRNCQACSSFKGCFIEVTSADIATLQYVVGLDADGCFKYSVPPNAVVLLVYVGCDNLPITVAQPIARCVEVDNKINTAISALRLVGCDGAPFLLTTPVAKCSDITVAINALRLKGCDGADVPITTPFVKCSEFANQLCQALAPLPSKPFVWGVTEVVTPDCRKTIIPQVTASVSISGGVLTLNVNGQTSQAPLPTDVQITNATISGTILTITESNGDVNQVDLQFILDGLKKCGGASFNHLVDQVVECSQFLNLLQTNTVNQLNITGNVVTSTVNGKVATALIPATTNSLTIVGNNLISNVDGVISQVPLSFVQVTSATLAGSILSVNESNGDTNTVDLLPLLSQIKTCDNSLFNPLTDTLVKCSQLPALPNELAITVNAPLTGNGLASSPLDINFLALSSLDKCDFGNGITSVAPITRVLGKDAAGCLTQYVMDCACNVNAPVSTYGLGCVGGELAKVNFQERLQSATI